MDDKQKILVIEDEIIIADNICDHLQGMGYETFEPVISYTEAVEAIDNETPDLAIIDINLAGNKTGIDVAKFIEKNCNFPYVFLTSNSDPMTLNEVKSVSPSGYIIKPFSKEYLFTTLEIAFSNFDKKKSHKKEFLFIKNKGNYIKLKIADILYIQSAHIYADIYLIDGQKHVIRKSLNDIINLLNVDFKRVHRSYIINKNHLTTLKSSHVILSNTKEIPIGKKYKDDLLSEFTYI